MFNEVEVRNKLSNTIIIIYNKWNKDSHCYEETSRKEYKKHEISLMYNERNDTLYLYCGGERLWIENFTEWFKIYDGSQLTQEINYEKGVIK